MSSPPYVTSSFAIKAEFTTESGVVEFRDILSFSGSYGLNTVPVATLVVATGREAKQSGKLATIHTARDQLRPGDEVKVTLTITEHDGQTGRMDQGTYVIFEGKYAGIGYQRSYNHANYVLHLVHWLDNLNQGSMINGNWFPGAPYDMAQNGLYIGLGPVREGAAGAEKGHPVPKIDTEGKLINLTTVQEDLWGQALRPVFEKIAKWPTPRYQDSERTQNEEDNKYVLAALSRMPGKGAQYYTPLKLDLSGIRSKNTVEAIKSALTKDALDSFAYTTFWNKLVGDYAPQFYFAISPAAEFALPVPFFAGLKTPYKTIKASEYSYSNFNASQVSVLESVDIFYSVNGDTGLFAGAPLPGAQQPSYKLVPGFYPPRDLQKKNKRRGLKLIKEPPTWMTNLLAGPAFAGRASGVGAPGKCVCSPAAGNTQMPAGFVGAGAVQVEVQQSQALTRFAEHWYKTEVLYQRQGEMSGKLRFDIAPGSVVGIETADYDLGMYDTLFATVTQVSYAINAEQATAGTSFSLAHIRSSKENEEETLVSDRPPMYLSPWKGAPLAIRT
jgi:hypothetical protein